MGKKLQTRVFSKLNAKKFEKIQYLGTSVINFCLYGVFIEIKYVIIK